MGGAIKYMIAAVVEDAQRSVIKEYISLKYSIHLFILLMGKRLSKYLRSESYLWTFPLLYLLNTFPGSTYPQGRYVNTM